MKNLLAAVLLLATIPANAEAWAAKNKSGGEIIITDAVCEFKGVTYKTMRKGLTRSPAGDTLFSCWYYADNLVYVLYDDGTTYTYQATGFVRVSP